MDDRTSAAALLETLRQTRRTTSAEQQAYDAVLQELVGEIARLRAEIEILRATVASQRPDQPYRPIPPTPVQPPLQRPLDYWANNVPDFGETLLPSDIERVLTAPRPLASSADEPIRPRQVPSWRYQRQPMQKRVVAQVVAVCLLAVFWLLGWLVMPATRELLELLGIIIILMLTLWLGVKRN